MPTGQDGGGNSLVEVPSSQLTLVCVRLTDEADHDTAIEAWGIHNISEAKTLGPESVML